ncbi:MAG TPA: aminoglycoside phosphotransferase family protein [Pseudonocardia sp.]|nr:aminoglycoside phosphotransferase family protein [Pseudonocardia sp.]
MPAVLAAGERRILLADVPGSDGWDPTDASVRALVRRWVAAQATLARHHERLPGQLSDGRGPAMRDRVAALLAGPLVPGAPGGLTAAESRAATDLLDGFAALDRCGLPDTLVHGDLHPGNWRCPPGRPPVLLDLADAHLGNPVLDGLRLCGSLPEAGRAVAARAWVEAWRVWMPGADPARALAIGAPLAHLGYAALYQEFLDGIEASERVYHENDPAESVREALRCAGRPVANCPVVTPSGRDSAGDPVPG